MKEMVDQFQKFKLGESTRKCRDCLDDILPKDILKMIEVLISFNIISFGNTRQEFLKIFERMFILLIYDFNRISYSTLVYTHCIPNSELSGLIKDQADVGGKDTELAENEGININKKDISLVYDPLHANHPLVRTFWSIKYHLRS